jgi:hypothetical protein
MPLEVEDSKEEVEQNGTHQLLIYADGINLLSININTSTRKKTITL